MKKSKNWYVEWRDHHGRPHRWAGYTSRPATEKLGRRLEGLVACRQSGSVISPDLSEWLHGLPMRQRYQLSELGLGPAPTASTEEHVDAYRAWLEAQEFHPRHVSDLISRLCRIFDGVPVASWDRLDPAAVESWLKDRRQEGMSIARSNGYIKAVKSFGNWMLRSRRSQIHTFKTLRSLNESVDPRHPRRPLTDDELSRLLETTRRAPDRFGLTGLDRYWAYRLASELGLLRGELQLLRPCDFDLGKGSVMIPASFAPKRRETHVLPVALRTCRELRGYLQDRPKHEPILQLPRATAAMMAKDLADAGIPYEDDAGRFADFYSLRHTAITRWGYTARSFADLQALARHRTPSVTARYAHARYADMRTAVESVPAPDSQKRSKKSRKRPSARSKRTG